jgi:3-deoxy-manno-octulosonate cytidylyltransferase (CMP-KDO synthetase)
MYKLCTIVPFKKDLLLNFTKWEETPLELAEDNHFLRILENGVKIKTVEIEGAKISVDTQSDLDEVRLLMRDDLIKLQYI